MVVTTKHFVWVNVDHAQGALKALCPILGAQLISIQLCRNALSQSQLQIHILCCVMSHVFVLASAFVSRSHAK